MSKGIDTSAWPDNPDVLTAGMQTDGVEFLFGYVSSPTKPRKVITPARFTSLKNHGRKVGLYYEEAADRAGQGAAAGTADATEFLSCITALGLPSTQPGIFCDDYSHMGPDVEPYFRAVKAKIGGPIGAYGGYQVIKYLFDKGIIDFAIQCAAWSLVLPGTDTRTWDTTIGVLKWDPRAQVHQCGSLSVAGVPCDLLESFINDYGQYPRPTVVVTPTPGGGVPVSTKEQKYREGAQKMVGDPYGLGFEGNPDDVYNPKYDVGDSAGSNPKLGDCSGDTWSDLVYADVYLNGKAITKDDRRTANGWYHLGVPVSVADNDDRVGIQCFLVGDAIGPDHAYHMASTIGNGQVFEMGYNHMARITTIAVWKARGAKWRKQNFDLGTLIPATTPVSTGVTVPNWPWLYKGVHSSDPVKQKAIAAGVYAYKTAMNRIQNAGLHPADDDYLDGCVAVTKKFQANTTHRDEDGHTLRPDGEVGAHTRYAIAVALSKLK